MSFSYSRQNLSPSERRRERIFEILPAAISWGLLALVLLLSIFWPVAGVGVIILVDLYWLLRLLYLTIFLLLSYSRLELERKTNWRERLEDLQESLSPPDPKEIYQLVIIPFYEERSEVLDPTLQALASVDYPLERIVVVLGIEERAGRAAREVAEEIKRRYARAFLHLEICIHPAGVPGEAAVKGANATHAAKWAKTFFESRRIPLDRVLVSCFDCDTVVSPGYLACLTYNYLIHPQRTRRSFQPIPVYHNNLWEAPPFARVLETGSSFFQLVEATDPETLVTFSSHSMSFQTLVEIGFWPVDLVSDDSAIFWKAFLAFNGDYRVEPLYVTLSMDVAIGRNFWETCQSIYRQKRRWAWGVENFPIFLRGVLSNPNIPFWVKVKHALRMLEMNVSWATWPLIMLVLSWAPILFATREFTSSVAHFNAPRVTGVMFNLATATLVISIILSLFLLPKRPRRVSLLKKLGFALQWLMIPVITILFGALPALDAQTRLALGRYMEFYVAPKGRFPQRTVPGNY